MLARLPGALAVQAILDRLGSSKGQLLGGLDLDGFAGRGVAAFAGRARLDLELAKAIERDFVTLGSGAGDQFADVANQLACSDFGQAVGFRNRVSEVVIVHDVGSPRFVMRCTAYTFQLSTAKTKREQI